MSKYPTTVSEGAKLLDRKMKSWEKKISISNLKMDEASRCILGQLYGSYPEGWEKLFNNDEWNCNTDEVYGSRVDKDKWITEINKRLNKVSDAEGMTFEKALVLLKQGKKLRQKSWDNSKAFITLRENGDFRNQTDAYWGLCGPSLIANNWMEYEGEKLSTLKPGNKFTFKDTTFGKKVYILLSNDHELVKYKGKKTYIFMDETTHTLFSQPEDLEVELV